MSTDIREQIFRVGLNYRIGGNGAAYVAPPPSNWAGFYLGGNFGGGIGRDRTAFTLAAVGTSTELFNLSPDGFNGGAQAGYNWQAGNWVFGLEADIQASSQRDNRACVQTCNPFAAPIIFAAYDATLPWFGTARGRVGYSVGSTMFYATGGYAYGNVKTKIAAAFLGVSGQRGNLQHQGWLDRGRRHRNPVHLPGRRAGQQLDLEDRVSLCRSRHIDGFLHDPGRLPAAGPGCSPSTAPRCTSTSSAPA